MLQNANKFPKFSHGERLASLVASPNLNILDLCLPMKVCNDAPELIGRLIGQKADYRLIGKVADKADYRLPAD